MIANKILNDKNSLQDNDSGDYYNEIEQKTRWAKTPIKVWIQHTNNNANLKNAFYTWQNALYPTIAFEMVNRKEDAQLQVVFGNLPQGSPKGAVGITQTRTYLKNPSVLGIATIYLTQFDPYGSRLSDNNIYGVLVHEIGHAIGIGGHSKNKNDVMYPSTDNYNLRPTRRDINTVRKIYSSIKLY